MPHVLDARENRIAWDSVSKAALPEDGVRSAGRLTFVGLEAVPPMHKKPSAHGFSSLEQLDVCV